MRVELWSYDEYNQGSIIASADNLEDVIAKGEKYVTEANVANALSSDERDKAWEAYFPQIFKGKSLNKDMLYAGNKRDGKHYVWVKKANKWTQTPMPEDVKVRFYLGEVQNGKTKKQWYLTDFKGKEITSFKDQSLERKTVLFVKFAG